jgi:sulfhydrogenase subunit alpha
VTTEGRRIQVDLLTRVEGEGALLVETKDGEASKVELRIFEPPRFFEALLRGRDHQEVVDIVARICGICPVAYQMSAVNALEAALGLRVGPEVEALRRLLYCGEWIESHALHVFLLHAPDFLGLPDGMSVAKRHPDLVKAALRLKKVGNAVVEAVGGRAIHPVNVRVGGFWRAPAALELQALVPELEVGLETCRAAARWARTLEFPALEREPELVALVHPTEYPMARGRIASTGGLDLDPSRWEEAFEEVHAPHSTALHARIKSRATGAHYLTGPLARFALNHARLSDGAKAMADEVGLAAPVRNPFKSILVRLVEVLYAVEEALRLIRAYTPPARPFVEGPLVAGVGHGATEAPRGLLWHRYRLEAGGAVAEARIVPPTSQNQASIEDDLRLLGRQLATLPLDDARRLAEQAVRNHDPCISCATHFLKLERREV